MNNKIMIFVLVAIVLILGLLFILKDSPSNISSVPPEVISNQISTTTSTSSPANSTSTIVVPAHKTYYVTIADFDFTPKTLNIKRGDTVVWTNKDSFVHQIVGHNLDSFPLKQGQSFSFTFKEAGTFNYYCSIHHSMKGSIIIK